MSKLTLFEISQEPNKFIKLEFGKIPAIWSYKATSVEDNELPRAFEHLDWLKKIVTESEEELARLLEDVYGWTKYTVPFNSDPIVFVERARARQETIDELHKKIANLRATLVIYDKAIVKQEAVIFRYIRSIDDLEEGEIV